MDVGAQNCLNFSYSVTPTASAVAYANGHGYVGTFRDTHIVKFIASGYSNGTVSVNYIFQ